MEPRGSPQPVVHADLDDVLHGRMGKGVGAADTIIVNVKAHIFSDEVDEVIFDLGTPVGRKGVFEAAAKQQTVKGGVTVRRRGRRSRDSTISEIEAPDGSAHLAVDEGAIDGEAQPHREVGIPPVARRGDDRKIIYRRRHDFIESVRDARPGPLALEAEHELARLVVAASLAAGETAATGCARCADKRVVHHPTAGVQAEIAAESWTAGTGTFAYTVAPACRRRTPS